MMTTFGEWGDVSGMNLPAQFSGISSWEDGSVRWALMDVQVEVAANGTADLVVSDGGGNPAPAAPVTVEDGAASVKVSTGPLEFVVNMFVTVTIAGITGGGRFLVVGAPPLAAMTAAAVAAYAATVGR